MDELPAKVAEVSNLREVEQVKVIEQLAKRIRVSVLEMTNRARASHVASALSIADIIATLYGGDFKLLPNTLHEPDRDRFILSKGHAGSAVYAALAHVGFLTEDVLKTYAANGSLLSGHISHKDVPGVELSTGSLGHGPPIAAGMALGLKRLGISSRIFCLTSDGECDEGSVWEAALFSAHHELSNLTLIIDYNRLQSLGSVSSILELEPFVDKWHAFGWRVMSINGHSISELRRVLLQEGDDEPVPRVVIANTLKGKGVSFMEGSVHWHYKSPSTSDLEKATSEIVES